MNFVMASANVSWRGNYNLREQMWETLQYKVFLEAMIYTG